MQSKFDLVGSIECKFRVQRFSEVALLCTPNGRIHFYLNGILIMHHTVDGIGNNQLWACLDLDGRTTTVTLLPDSAASADEVGLLLTLSYSDSIDSLYNNLF